MSNFPITPYFFSKIGIYQEILEINEYYPDKKLWKIEKTVLKWCATEHRHLSVKLDAKHIKKVLKKNGYSEHDFKGIAGIVMGNLCQRNFAKPIEITYYEEKNSLNTSTSIIKERYSVAEISIDQPDYIVINNRGLLAGQVIRDLSSNNWIYKNKYELFVDMAWIGILVLFIQAVIAPILIFFNFLMKYFLQFIRIS